MILCKHCKKCEKLIYQRILRNKRKISFKYCKGNKHIVESYKWTISNNKKRPQIYTSNFVDGAHRQITYFFPRGKKEVISPIDKNHLNFTLDNLERLTKSQMMQKYNTGASIFPGVSIKNIHHKHKPHEIKWQAALKFNDEKIYLGVFDDEYQAAHAYYSACLKYNQPIKKDIEAYQLYLQEKKKRNLNKTLTFNQKLRKNELFNEFLFRRKITNKSTISQYVYSLSAFTSFVGKSLSEILTEAKEDYNNNVFPDEGCVYQYLTDFQKYLMQQSISNTTRAGLIAKVKTFYRTFFIPVDSRIAYEKEYRLKKSLEDIITIFDVKRLFDNAPLNFKPVILCLFSSGLRINDLLKMDCQDFVKSMRYCSEETKINNLLDDLKPQIFNGNLVAVVHNITMKTDKSHYTFFSPQAVRWIILSLLSRKEGLNNDSPLFYSKTGKKLKYTSAERYLITIREELGYGYAYNSKVNKIHFHGFRDAFATIMAPHMDYFRLENLMGHEHVLGHGNYVVQDPVEDLKLYQKLMYLLMFDETGMI